MDDLLIILYLYVFIIGTCVGSFLNVVIWRVPQALSLCKGRSYCPHCHTTLKPYDMIPMFSWIWLRGKCRVCKAPISKRYPMMEAIGGIVSILCFVHYNLVWQSVAVYAIAMILLAITMIDFDTMSIPNGLLLSLLVPILAMCLLEPEIAFLDRLLGFLIVSVPMYALTLCIPDCFGGGDIKLIALCGLLLGWKFVLVAMFLAVLLGGSYATYLLLLKKKTKDAHIAFGPYLCFGVMISLFYGMDLIHAYLALFGLSYS